MKIAVIAWWDKFSGRDLATALGTKYDTVFVDREQKRKDYHNAMTDADYIIVKGDLHMKRSGQVISIYHPEWNKPLPDMSGHRIKKGAKIIFCPSGGNFRRKIPGYYKAKASRPLSDYASYDFIAPQTPDLNYPGIKGLYLPQAIDVGETYNAWREHDPPVITAYNGTYDSKGVEKYLIPAVREIKKRGIAVVMNQFRTMPKERFIELKKNSTICFGQMAPMGVYGTHETQAMSFGIPTIISLNPVSVRQALPIEDFGGPCLKANNAHELVKVLTNALTGKTDLKKVSEDTMAYMQRVHSNENIVAVFEQIVERIS